MSWLEDSLSEHDGRAAEAGIDFERLLVLERVIDESPDGFSLVDRNYVYRTVNRVYLELHGKSMREIVGHSIAELLGEDVFHKVVKPQLDRCFAGQPVRYESWFSHSTGQQRYMEVRYYPLSHNGHVDYAVAVIHDMTERQRAEADRIMLAEERAARKESLLGAVSIFSDTTALHELQEKLQDLVRAVSHDLRTPLQVIQGQAQVLARLLDNAGIGGQEMRSVEAIIRSTRQMNTMIGDLVDSARVDSGQLNPHKEPVELAAFLTDLLDRTRGVMDIARIRLEIPANLPRVSADSSHLERILVNLISNGLKYSAPNTELSVVAFRGEAAVTLSVIDHGFGISAEDLPHLFERFYRTRKARKIEGMGLGLYITKALVEAQGGRIRVESEPGKGSTFYVSLPVA